MKLQHLAIIFIIIILPISLVVGEYIQSQIDTIYLQTSYSKRLQDATYDAIKAFQLNTINNKYSSISDSKIRDIEASVATFYNSLGTSMGASGYDKEELKEYIPAILYTMYDGYYIYGKYFNYDENANQYQYGLKPYIYYSCRYVGNNYDFVVNYTLDNSITIYGKVPNGGYITDSGYVINSNLVSDTQEYVSYGEKKYPTKVTYDGVIIDKEILSEQLIIIDENGQPENTNGPVTYQYTKYNNQKIYKENNSNSYFYYKNNKKEPVSDDGKVLRADEITELRYAQTMTIGGNLYSNSAVEYYVEAKKFSKRLEEYGISSTVTQANAVDNNGNQIKDFSTNTGNAKIFKFDSTNDPLLEGSVFNENRMSVIRKSIESNLIVAIANYNSGSSGLYEFQMPKFTEEDWEKVLNNISVSVFMQGIPMKSKYFNSYCIVTNNKNEEVVTLDSIYILSKSEKDGIQVHLPGCTDLINNINEYEILGAYNIIDFERQTVVISEGNETYYYPQYASKCYNCIVNAAQTYEINGIISNNLQRFDIKSNQYQKYNKDISTLRKIYLTALGRERYDLYRTNGYF